MQKIYRIWKSGWFATETYESNLITADLYISREKITDKEKSVIRTNQKCSWNIAWKCFLDRYTKFNSRMQKNKKIKLQKDKWKLRAIIEQKY